MSELTSCSRHGNKTKSLCSLYEASRVLASFMILLVLTFCGMRLADLHGHGHEKVSGHARRSHTGGLENVQNVSWGRNHCQPLFGRTSPPTSQKLWIQLRTTSQSGSRSNLQLCNFRFKLVRQTGANHSLDGFGHVIGSRRGPRWLQQEAATWLQRRGTCPMCVSSTLNVLMSYLITTTPCFFQPFRLQRRVAGIGAMPCRMQWVRVRSLASLLEWLELTSVGQRLWRWSLSSLLMARPHPSRRQGSTATSAQTWTHV